jgi:phage terminase large subunit GpA-like protein
VSAELELTPGQLEWLAQLIEGLTTEIEIITPSMWAERQRYLPPSATPLPGLYRFSVAPYLREIVDCFSIDSPIREVSLMKGVQVCATTGILENVIGYAIEHVKSAPCMMITADGELAKARMDGNVIPMLQLSGLDHLVKSQDTKNPRKTGRTDKRIEWMGGGFLIPYGAQNANKLRSIPVQYLMRDEVDGWPLTVGADGDPMQLSADRTAAYEGIRKILDLSTPKVKGQSKIEARFALGDKRYYHVCCLRCGKPQVLHWQRVNSNGEISGIVWELQNERLIPESVRYLCESCGHAHTNDDKTRLLAPEHGAEWRPTAEPSTPHHRSYHLSALYSPVGMQTWGACVQKYLEAWDPTRNTPRDMGKLQVFKNNVLGETFELIGERVRFEHVSPHRRHWYGFGEIPNRMALRHCGSPVLLLTCTVDVHKDNLAVAVFGWCRDRRVVLIDYWRFEGNTEQLDDAGTWLRLRALIEEHVYTADDGTRYRIQLTLIDCGYRTDTVYRFCADYAAGVFPVKGRESPPKHARVQEFSEYKTPMGLSAFGITVDLYKDRWSAALRRSWDGEGVQPETHFNAPIDTTDAQLKELTVETKRERVDDRTGQRIGWEWWRPSGAANELWDLLVYANTALDLIAWNYCVGQRERESVSWIDFWQFCETGAFQGG